METLNRTLMLAIPHKMAPSWLAHIHSFFQTYPEILFSTACFLFLAYLRPRRSSTLPVNYPIIGMLPALLTNLHRLHDWSTDILRESKYTFLFRGPWLSNMDILITSDPANASHVFTANFPNYPKGSDYIEIYDILGDGIFNVDGDSWRTQRQLAHTLMSQSSFRTFVATSTRDKVVNGLLPVLLDGSTVDLQDILLRLTFDLTCNMVFGIDPCCLSPALPTIPFVKAMDDALSVTALRHVSPSFWWKLLRWLRIGQEKKMTLAWEVIGRFITDTITIYKSTEHTGVDLLTSYIKGIKSTAVNDRFLRDTTINFMVAGRDTTGTGLAWLFWLLINNPPVEARLLRELESCTSTTRANDFIVFDHDEIARLVYLHAIICESLRLFPPVPFQHKAVREPEMLPSGAVARPGMKMLFTVYGMGRMEGVWGEDCMEFKPERWISECGRLRHEPSYKFLTFNSGPRTCLGRHIAFTQMKAVVAAVVYNFEMKGVEGHVVEPKFSSMLHMKNGLMVKVRKRGRG